MITGRTGTRFGWVLSLSLCATAAAAAAGARPPAHTVAAEHGAVVTVQHLATEIGVDVLRRGGNAVDAAVAVGYALAVVYPDAGNLGGGGFMTLDLAGGRRTFIDFREKAPQRATRTMYLDASGKVMPGASERGYLAAGVPGTVAGLEYARIHYGTWSRARLIQPAIDLAQNGFVLEAGDADILAHGTELFARDPASARIYLNQGRPFAAGERLVQHDLAATLRAIRDRGADGFYRGVTARRMAQANATGGGLITEEDLKRYRVRELAPVECDYRGYHVVSAPPPSSGGVVLCEMLHIVEGYPLGELGFGSVGAVHDEVEAMRHAYLDRNSELGDPAFVDNPVARLISPEYAAAIRATIDPEKPTPSDQLRPGTPPHEGRNTTHYSIIDAAGNAVSVTYTLNARFGAGVTVPGAGFLLNDEMDDFTVDPGVANRYRLVQGEANAIAPGKTPLSSMTPTVVERDGRVVLVVGTPGGSLIPTVVFQTILDLVDYRMNLAQAVEAPRLHQQWLPDIVYMEPGAVTPAAEATLSAQGYRFRGWPIPNFVAAIIVGAPRLDGSSVPGVRYFGVADPRIPIGTAGGY